MTLSLPKIKEMDMRKAIGEVSLMVPVDGHINQIRNDLNIAYSIIKKDDEPSNELKVTLECDIHTDEKADPDTAGKLEANVEIVYQVVLNDTFNPANIEDVMLVVWPYLRLGALHQMQLIDLGFVGDELPYEVLRKKPENASTPE
ncbi:hypothetical protein [Bifidobacterium mizhiense]|uniref:hypothetical protein n=1 Tax=Bifidobacterium mizhiense TaxID=2879940 RepID=UPI001E455FF7|nr:hypothetical protein [Bifidobacterium mizhiense]